MPDIDPAALSRSDSIAPSIPHPLNLSKVNGASQPSSSKAQKTTNAAQRIDLEPLYTILKAAIGDNWARYKDAISLFILGISMNQLLRARANLPLRLQVISIKMNFPCKLTPLSAPIRIQSIFTINSLLPSTAMFYEMSRTRPLHPGSRQTINPSYSRSRWREMKRSKD